MKLPIFVLRNLAAACFVRPISARPKFKHIQAVQGTPCSLSQLPREPGFSGASIAENYNFSHWKGVERVGAVRHFGLLCSNTQETGN
jgi:hypothetical protein